MPGRKCSTMQLSRYPWGSTFASRFSKVMDAEKQRTASEKEHLAKSAAFTEIEAKVKTLEKKLSRHIEKSKPYFEQKDVFNKALNAEKTRVQQLQVDYSILLNWPTDSILE